MSDPTDFSQDTNEEHVDRQDTDLPNKPDDGTVPPPEPRQIPVDDPAEPEEPEDPSENPPAPVHY